MFLQGQGGAFLDSNSDNNYFTINLGSRILLRSDPGFSIAFWTRNDVEIDWNTYIAKYNTIDDGNAQGVVLAIVRSGVDNLFKAYNTEGNVQENDLEEDQSQDAEWNYNVFVFGRLDVTIYRNSVKRITNRAILIEDEPHPWYIGMRKDVIDPTSRRRLSASTKNGLIIYSVGFYVRALTESELTLTDVNTIRGTLDSCPLS